ncbi:MAG: glycosyltransferase [Methylococcales symbiont of Hymedesmia sp. n. MRB-2018]|nr:MAG: glycosyltransferase [Methylococcales symbiont of Hymedesmia sp. n. MRB-2018]
MLVSVLMPVYNAEKYLDEAIQSILNQTFTDFEFIIINDGSSDNSLNIIKKYQQQDSRIVVVSRENKGLIFSLNEGVSLVKGKYIVRMDADDISLPTRIERQIAFLEEHNLDICGSASVWFNQQGEQIPFCHAISDRDIKFSFMFYCALQHPTVIMNTCIFKSLAYDQDFKYAEDYKMWIDVALQGYKIGNTPEVLFKYRQHENQICHQYAEEQEQCAKEIALYYLSQLKEVEIEKYAAIFLKESSVDVKIWEKLCKALIKYKQKNNISDAVFLQILKHVIINASQVSPAYYWVYRQYTKGMKKNFMVELYFQVRCLLLPNRESKLSKLVRKLRQLKLPIKQ